MLILNCLNSSLFKKKKILLLSFCIFITCNSIVAACSIDNFFVYRKNIITFLNASDNSLLKFYNASPSLLVENMAGLKANTFGVGKLSISLLHKDGPILKNITNITALDNLNEDLNKLNFNIKSMKLA